MFSSLAASTIRVTGSLCERQLPAGKETCTQPRAAFRREVQNRSDNASIPPPPAPYPPVSPQRPHSSAYPHLTAACRNHLYRNTQNNICTRTVDWHVPRSVQSTSDNTEYRVGRRSAIAAVLALAAFASSPVAALADEPVITAAAVVADAAPQTVFFGNGCFWGRQKEFVDAEKLLGRSPDQVSAVVGYAGGKKQGPGGKVCYYYGPGDTVYEKLGHAEVVQLELQGAAPQAEQQMRAFADTYFGQFIKTPFGMMRSDPMDAGPGYRNVVGIPGGVGSSLFKAFEERNVNAMDLREGDGNDGDGGKEGDRVNVVWVVDSSKLAFHRAEDYHQFHDGMGKPYGPDYKVQQRRIAAGEGRIGPTGCPEAGGFLF